MRDYLGSAGPRWGFLSCDSRVGDPSQVPWPFPTPAVTSPPQKPILLQGHERSITQIKYNREGDLLFTVAKDPVSVA